MIDPRSIKIVQGGMRFLAFIGLYSLMGCPSSDPTITRPHIYVADSNNNRIVRIDDMEGNGWTTLGGVKGNGFNQFDTPNSLFVDPDRHLYILDSGNSRVVRSDDMNGRGWVNQGHLGDGNAQFQAPSCVFGDRENRIYVADRNNDRIIRMDDMNG